MKIEEGKYYRTRNGRKVGAMKPSGHEDCPWIAVRGDGQAWEDDGTGVSGTDSPDLIAEWVDDEPRLWKDLSPEEKGALLLAHHEGRDIQMYASDHWYTVNPIWEDFTAYRIKPEPVRNSVEMKWGLGSLDTHRITFDLVDGVPDCSSIKMEKIK